MRTLKELFEQDFEDLLGITREVAVLDEASGDMLAITERVSFDFERAKAFVSYLVPYSTSTLTCCAAVMSRPAQALQEATSSFDVIQRSAFSPDGIAASALQFSREIVFYTENQLDQGEQEALQGIAEDLNYKLFMRGPEYSEMRAGLPKLIDKFMREYERSYDYYFSAARLVADALDNALISRGIRTWVSFRAKRPDSLAVKIERRALSLKNKKGYRTIEDIYADIVDLAGVRVALYFPKDRQDVDAVIKEFFDVHFEKQLSGSTALDEPKKFSGYWATHYRVSPKKDSLKPAEERYHRAKVEIQVATIIMQAWSEIEHDLVYKPQGGSLSHEEHAILDELNGVVLQGERVLERLQKAGERRRESLKEWKRQIAELKKNL